MPEDTFNFDNFTSGSGRVLKKNCAPTPTEVPEVFSITPEVMYFHFVGLGQSSAWQQLLIQNVSAEPAPIGIVLPSLAEFIFIGDVPLILQPNEILTLQVRFTPTSLGTVIDKIKITGEGAQLPAVHLIGIGGSIVATAPAGTVDEEPLPPGEGAEAGGWAYRYGAFATYNILSNEIVMDYGVTQKHILQSNFAGCHFSVGNPPSVSWTATVKRNNISIGTITVKPSGIIIAATNGGLAYMVEVGDIISVHGDGNANTVLERLRMTFVGISEEIEG